ncbi:hypothetical protein LR48_Vigan06g031900 [Vigna angularis]|uniref:Caffeoyl-CoA O-methyltransferase n=1 Tax=Phaseolus angularis TaxID=3914 RepID=A0A0L9UQK7_PHAAN|nr:hypothetical protein LR48_Vigan06g031900 [Vigna angularis]
MTITNEDQQQIQIPGHKHLRHKSLLQSDALYQYILETSVYPREHESLKELRELTEKHPWNLLATPPDEGQLLRMLLKILAMDISREYYELGLPVIEKAGVAHKIDFREGPALPLLDQLIKDEKNKGSFDFIFVDADKDNYLNYHNRVIELVKIGGMIAYDNTLWNGSVAAPSDAPLLDYIKYYRDFVIELNQALALDSRVEICQLPVGDGITLCRRII